MRRLRRILLTIAVTVAAVYAGAIVYLMTQETRLVFANGRPLAASRPAAPFEQLTITRADGQPQFAWVMRHAAQAESAPWVLFLHGNSATVASRVNILRYEALRKLGLNVVTVEYRGFGGLDGVPTEASVTEDARQGYRFVREALRVPTDRLVIYGWSLGSAVAVNLASEVPARGIVLEGAPASLVAIGERRYPWLPIHTIMRNPFESIAKVRKISAPLLFLHSPEDEIIPIEEGRRLYDAAPEPKTFVEVRGGHINPAELDAERMFGAVRDFLQRLGLLPQ
jgi:uncharacterized protein